MLRRGLDQFADKKVLLLQGPVGPFFARLKHDLEAIGAQVYKINFNAGDWIFCRGNLNYQGTPEAWPGVFASLLDQWEIDVVLLFGDQRPVHLQAHAVALSRGLEIGVFEEGYFRPDHITFERHGVNGRSSMSRLPSDYRSEQPFLPKTEPVGNAYWRMVAYGFLYFAAGIIGRLWFRHYRHHRPFTVWAAIPWIRSVWRKQWYRFREWGIQTRLSGADKGKFFLVPLQVFNDSQITSHADFFTIDRFIEYVVYSFAGHAPKNALLVFKHHPMDRGHSDYGDTIRRLAARMGLQDRVLYIHDQHLPTLLDAARGVVVINSTVGLAALQHGIPVKVCGVALYALPGLTFSDSLDKFWCLAGIRFKLDKELFSRFKGHLMARTQINGSFYKPLLGINGKGKSGLVWPVQPDEENLHTVATVLNSTQN
jgi:capsular polysaccharide export protein